MDSAKFYAFNSLVAASNDEEKAFSYFYMGYVAKKQTLLHEAVTYYRKALKMTKDQGFILTTQSNLANVLHNIGKTEEALRLIIPVLKAREQAKHRKLHYVYNVLANVYSAANQLDSARLYYRKSLETDRGKVSKSGTRWDLAVLYLKRYRNTQNKVYLDSAIALQQKGILESKNSPFMLASGLVKLGGYYKLKGNYAKALQCVDSSLAIQHNKIITKFDATHEKAEVLSNLGRTAEAQQWYEKASKMLETITADPAISPEDRNKIERKGAMLSSEALVFARRAQEENQALQNQIWVIIGLMLLVLALVAGLFWYAVRQHQLKRQEDLQKIAEGEERLAEQKSIADRNLNDFLKMAKDKQTLHVRYRDLQQDFQQENSKKDLAFFGQVLRVEFEARMMQTIQNLLANQVAHDKIEGQLGKFYKDLSRLNSLTNAFLQLRPYFNQNLEKLLKEREVSLSQKQQRLCMLLAAKDLGVDNSIIQTVFGYKDHAGLKTLRDRTAKKLGTTLKELDGFLIELSKQKP